MENTDNTIINVPSLEPRLKHPTIFNAFDNLKEGQSLTIHNDHDPKPLYYQLLAQKGNIFTWDYLEEGPVWWKVKIRKRVAGETNATLGELAAKDLRKAEIFKKYDLDYSSNGKQTLKEACAEKGLDLTQIEQELQQVDKVPQARPLLYTEWSLSFLSDFIENVHHLYVKKNLPDILGYAQKVMEVHHHNHPELTQINDLVKSMAKDLTDHMASEEQKLFPLLKTYENGADAGPKKPSLSANDFQRFITQHEADHASVGNEMKHIRKLTNNYTLPDDACASYTLLYNKLEEFEADLDLHIHLENNIMFPRAIELQKQLS